MMTSLLFPARLPRLHGAFEVHSRGSDDQIARHAHEAVELVLVVEGHVQIGVGETDLDGPVGTLYVLPSGVPHDQRCRGNWMTQCILFDQTERLIEETPRTLDLKADDQLRRWIQDLCRLAPAPVFGEAHVAQIGSGLLLAVLGRISQAERHSLHRQEMHPQLALAVQYLHDHLTEEVPLNVLASVACVSGSHLRALFYQQFGCGPRRYQQRLRLESAQALLRNPYLSVEEVARRCGYDDPNYFARLFRRVTGQPPSQWRTQGLHPTP